MNSLFCMQTVAADAAADAAISNIRKQRELEMEIKEIDKRWLFALKRIIHERLDLLKEFDKINRVKVSRDYFKGDLRKTRLHNYTDHVRNRMNEQKYIKSHDNFDFQVDPLGKNVVPEPMIMEGDGKEGREAITSISLDKKKARHIRGLSELEVKKRRFRIPKVKKKTKKALLAKGMLPIPQKHRMKRFAMDELEELREEMRQEEEENAQREQKETSITIKYSPPDDEPPKQSLFEVPEFQRTYIPLPVLPLTPEPSFVDMEKENSFSLHIPRTPSEVTPRLLSPIPPLILESRPPLDGENVDHLSQILEDTQAGDAEDSSSEVKDESIQISSNGTRGPNHSHETPASEFIGHINNNPQLNQLTTNSVPVKNPSQTETRHHQNIPQEAPSISLPSAPDHQTQPQKNHQKSFSQKGSHLPKLTLDVPKSHPAETNRSPRSPVSFLPPSPFSPIPPHLVLINPSRATKLQLLKEAKERQRLENDAIKEKEKQEAERMKEEVAKLKQKQTIESVRAAEKVQLLPILSRYPKSKSVNRKVKFAIPARTSHELKTSSQLTTKPPLKPLPPIKDLKTISITPVTSPVKKSTDNKQKALNNLSRSVNSHGMQFRKLSAVKEE